MTDGDEYDWLTKEGRRALGYRKWLRWLKRKYNKRLRKELKRALGEWDE
jgi:DNA-binding transcriptional MocR family regulator